MAVLMSGFAEVGLTTAKFVRFRASDGFWWSTSAVAFQAYASGSIANYGIAATEVGSTGRYTATDPADTTAGDYLLVKAAGASLVVSDVATGVRWQDRAGDAAQTGDAFARLGAPAGASVSVDVAAVQSTATAALAAATQGSDTGDNIYARIGVTGSGLTSLTPAAWGARVLGNGRTADMFLQGLTNLVLFASDGLSWTLMSTDDVTPLATGTSTRLATTVGGLRGIDPA